MESNLDLGKIKILFLFGHNTRLLTREECCNSIFLNSAKAECRGFYVRPLSYTVTTALW